MNKNVKMLVLGYITIAQFTMLSASVTANANELQDENVTEIIESIDNTDNAEEYINEDIIGEDEVDKNQEDEVDKNQIVNIPDKNVREVLLKELGLKEEDNITISQLETITKLSLYSSNNIKIVDLTGLEYCKNLIELTCSWSSVSDLTPLKNLVKLEKIKLNGNKISDISVLKNLVNLKELSIGNNDISDISVLKNLINLEWLSLDNNKISDISVLKNLVNLKKLYIGNNDISDISALKDLVNLEHLVLCDNKISDVSVLKNLINLEYLNLDNNNISDISALKDLVNLKELMLSDNNIIDISPIANSTKLIFFWAWNNKINDISVLENLINLQELLLLNNNITEITSIEKLDKIIKLDLSNNKIKNIDALENSPIHKLYLGDNEIQDISVLSTCNNLISLQLSKNKISDISSLSGLHNLGYLTLDNNEISDISPLTGLQNLRSLYLNNNNISDISDISCIGNYRILERIDISNNKISDISVLENRRVQELAINNNPITNIDLSKNYSYEINIDTEQQKYIKNYEDNWTSINIVLDPIKEVGTSIKIKNPIEYVSMDKVRFENAIYNEEDNTLFIDNIDSTSKTRISITYWAEGNTSGYIIIPIEKEPELDEEINVEIPEHIKDIIDTTVVTPVSGNGLKENPLILEAKEVSVDKVKELVNSFDKANVVCETIENDGTYTKYKFKLVNSITRSLDETYFTIIVANSQIDIINLLNNHYEIKNDDTNNGNDSDEDNSNNSSSAGGSEGIDESDGNGGATEDNLNKNEGTTNDSIIVKPENNTNQDANNKVESNISKLPVTGQAVASSLFVAFGTFLTGVGTFISRKKKDNK